MTNQIIKTYVDIFESFVKKHFILEQDYYVYNMDVYKKLSFGTIGHEYDSLYAQSGL